MTEIVMSQTPPILHGPSEKERKYDRQLRLWAASGQAALESANILLVNSGSGTVGAESLKNLVLPGIGLFAVYDEAKVDEADLGVNFFVDASYLGKPRSQCITHLLLELNPEVRGEWYPKDEGPASLQETLATSATFTIIMFTYPISLQNLALIEAYGKEHKTPLVAIHSAGYYSYFRIQFQGSFPIVDTHPDQTATTDLRLLEPWPELVAFAKESTANIDQLGDHEHGHLPWLVILLHFLDRWKETHGGAYPSNYKEKTEFRQMVEDATRRDNSEGGEENFEEAVAAVLKTVAKKTLPDNLKEVFEYERTEPAEQTSGFWIIADAVKEFYEKHKYLPLPGNVPDMKAKSNVYIRLQNIYKAKARRDAAEVLSTVQAKPGGRDINPAEVDLFCKNAAFVKLVIARTKEDGVISTADRLRRVYDEQATNDEMAALTLQPLSLLPVYMALQATSHVASASADEIVSEVAKAVPEAVQNERVIKAAQEVARAEGGELHNIAAVAGGLVAQETIKIITKQYIPIDNTCVFDGIASRTQVFCL